jgi:hypothetical protein
LEKGKVLPLEKKIRMPIRMNRRRIEIREPLLKNEYLLAI